MAKPHYEPRTYWFVILEIARDKGDKAGEQEARRQLRRLGVGVGRLDDADRVVCRARARSRHLVEGGVHVRFELARELPAEGTAAVVGRREEQLRFVRRVRVIMKVIIDQRKWFASSKTTRSYSGPAKFSSAPDFGMHPSVTTISDPFG